MEPRLSTSVFAGALIRRVQNAGGFAAVLSKGDPTSGSVTLILTEKGRKRRILERILEADGRYRWRPVADQAIDNEEEFTRFLERRRRFDEDSWLIELDVASAERFAAEMNSDD